MHVFLFCIATCFQGVTFLGFPALRAIISDLVSADDVGKFYVYYTNNDIVIIGAVFVITGSVQTAALLCSTVVLNIVYRPETIIEGHVVNARIVFWITAGIWALSLPLIV